MGIRLCSLTRESSHVAQPALLPLFKAGGVIRSTIIKSFVGVAGGPITQSQCKYLEGTASTPREGKINANGLPAVAPLPLIISWNCFKSTFRLHYSPTLTGNKKKKKGKPTAKTAGSLKHTCVHHNNTYIFFKHQRLTLRDLEGWGVFLTITEGLIESEVRLLLPLGNEPSLKP